MKKHILIDSGNYFSNNNNQGDRALYQIISRRLRQIWPDCEIDWITRNEKLLIATCSDVSPLVLTHDRLPLLLSPRCRFSDQILREAGPGGTARRQGNAPEYYDWGSKGGIRPVTDSARILSALRDCDLVLATGGGYFSDCFADHAWTILDTLEAGMRFGKPAIILSCGFEPIRDPTLSRKMMAVLPRLNLVGCRESLQSPAVVRSFGVAEQQVAVTGDDAVELAFEARPPALGDGLGINLRRADYAGVDAGTIEHLRGTLQQVANGLAASLLPVPISMSGPSDPDAICALLAGFPTHQDTGQHLAAPEDIVRQVGRCRLVITGSYHAAVFALSQGVSVVALAASPHYMTKLQGLQAQFGAGCSIVPLNRSETNETLAAAIAERWRGAESARSLLLKAAERQVAASRDAYQRVHDIVESDRERGRRRARRPSSEGFTAPGDQTAAQSPAQFALSPDEMEEFQEQGFLGPFTAFEPQEMEKVRRIIYDRVLTIPTPYCPFGLRVRHLDSRTVYELCSSPPIVDRMASLLGPDLILWNSNLFNKPPAEPDHMEEYPWHQDYYNWQIKPVLNVSAWLAITPATPENGCVEVIPGSHRQNIPPIRDTDPRLSLRFGGVASDPACVDETKKMTLALKPGQFFLFNERLLHHSNPNLTRENRLGLAVRVTTPVVRVNEPFPCILLRGHDHMGFNRCVTPPAAEPDTKWLASLPEGHDFTFDRPIPGMGWHLRETDGPHHFAWTGLEPDAWIDFRPVGAGDHVLRCEIIHMLAPQAVNAVHARVNGHLLTLRQQRVDNMVILEAYVPGHVLRICSDRVRVSLRVPELLRPCDINPASGDKRTLGLGIRRIALTPALRTSHCGERQDMRNSLAFD